MEILNVWTVLSVVAKIFTITNNMGSLIWNCYKAGCHVSGGKRGHLTAEDIRKSLGSVAEETLYNFRQTRMDCKKTMIAEFCDEWKLDPKVLGLLYDVKEHRVVFPRPQGNAMIDATGRSLGKRIPKWKRYGKSSLPYVCGHGTTAVVVEDCVSAAIVGTDGFVGVAVLGTSLSMGIRSTCHSSQQQL